MAPGARFYVQLNGPVIDAYKDLKLPTHSRHVYKVRSVYKDGRAGEWSGVFEGLTRGRR